MRDEQRNRWLLNLGRIIIIGVLPALAIFWLAVCGERFSGTDISLFLFAMFLTELFLSWLLGRWARRNQLIS